MLNLKSSRWLRGLCVGLVGAGWCSAVADGFVIAPYLQHAATDSIHVMWELDHVSDGAIEWGPTPKLGHRGKGVPVPAENGDFPGQENAALYRARISGLKAATRYYYRVVAGAAVSETASFITPAEQGAEAPLRILVTSDVQGGAQVFKDRVYPNGIAPWLKQNETDAAAGFDLMMFPGDLVKSGKQHSHWVGFFDALDPVVSGVPLYPVLGNHEYGHFNYYRYMTLPENGDPAHSERWWFKDYSNIRIIGLDSNDLKGDLQGKQLKWLDRVLLETAADVQIDFVLAQIHHPHESELWPSGNHGFTGTVMERLSEFSGTTEKPSMIYYGHTHGYSRGQNQEHGLLMVNVGGGGGHLDDWGGYNNQIDYESYPVSASEHGFAITHVTAGESPLLRMDWHGEEGDRFVVKDSVSIRKNNQPPVRPTVVDLSRNPVAIEDLVLTISGYEDAENDAMEETQWQIAADSNFKKIEFSQRRSRKNIFFDEDLNQNRDLLMEAPAAIQLASGQIYHWRARWRDSSMGWSAWTKPVSFEVAPSGMVELLKNSRGEKGSNHWNIAPDTDVSAMRNGGDSLQVATTNRKKLAFISQTYDLAEYAGDRGAVYYGAEIVTDHSRGLGQVYVEFLDEKQELISKSAAAALIGTDAKMVRKRSGIPEGTSFLKVIVAAGTGRQSLDSAHLTATFKGCYLLLDSE